MTDHPLLYVRCEHCNMGDVVDEHGLHDICPHCSATLTREAPPAEALTVLLPDVGWEGLRESVAMYHRFGPKRTPITDMADIVRVARRLLAVYDGKDG